jgi:hypothetical protein
MDLSCWTIVDRLYWLIYNTHIRIRFHRPGALSSASPHLLSGSVAWKPLGKEIAGADGSTLLKRLPSSAMASQATRHHGLTPSVGFLLRGSYHQVNYLFGRQPSEVI